MTEIRSNSSRANALVRSTTAIRFYIPDGDRGKDQPSNIADYRKDTRISQTCASPGARPTPKRWKRPAGGCWTSELVRPRWGRLHLLVGSAHAPVYGGNELSARPDSLPTVLQQGLSVVNTWSDTSAFRQHVCANSTPPPPMPFFLRLNFLMMKFMHLNKSKVHSLDQADGRQLFDTSKDTANRKYTDRKKAWKLVMRAVSGPERDNVSTCVRAQMEIWGCSRASVWCQTRRFNHTVAR